jgi:hypothetical protein
MGYAIFLDKRVVFVLKKSIHKKAFTSTPPHKMETTVDLQKITGKIIVYQPDNSLQNIEVNIFSDTARFSLKEMVKLFGRDKSVISRHIKI